MGWDSVVGIAMHYRLVFEPQWWQDFPDVCRLALRPTQPPAQSAPVLLPAIKFLGHDTDHPPPSSTKVDYGYSYTLT